MIGTDDLISVQDARKSQGTVTHKNTKNKVTPTERKQRKAIASPPRAKPIKKIKAKVEDPNSKRRLFDENEKNENALDSNKENIEPNTKAPLIKYHTRSTNIPLTPETELYWQENPFIPKELLNARPIKFSNRFEKTPEALAVTVEALNEQQNNILSQQTLLEEFKPLKNHHAKDVHVLPEKIEDVRVCEDEDHKQFSQFFSVKTQCSKIRFFATPLKPEEHRKRFGKVVFDDQKTQETVKTIQELKKKQDKSEQKDNEKKCRPSLTLEKIEKNPDLLVYVSSPSKNVKRYERIPVTLDILKKWEIKGQKPRTPTQQSSFRMSAKQYATLFGFQEPDDQFEEPLEELTHGIGYSLGGLDGENPQDRKNLFVATTGANTWMMLGEDLARYLLIDHQKLVKKVFITVEVQYKPGTKIAERIYYAVAWTAENSNVEKSISYKIKADQYDAPPKVLEKYLRKLVDKELGHVHDGEKLAEKSTIQNYASLKPRLFSKTYSENKNDNNNNNNNSNVLADITNCYEPSL